MSRDSEHQYGQFVDTKARDAQQILVSLTGPQVQMLHAALGIGGEAGEVVDVVKKAVMYSQPLDKQKLIIELGDLEFYLQMLRSTIGITRAMVIDANVHKLTARYADAFSAKEALQRRDTLRSGIDDGPEESIIRHDDTAL